MQEVFVAGDEPVPGYKLLDNIGGSAFYRMWKVKTPDGSTKLWKEIDLVVGNAAIETRTLSLLVQLRHPNLNTLTNFWQLNDGKTLIIETDEPIESLKERIDEAKKSGNPIPLEDALTFVSQAAEGLDFLNKPQHDFQGSTVAIYHRALRPECLLLFKEGGKTVCKVSDFGLAKPVTEETAGHSQGLLHYDYDPPEFFEGQTSPTSDQYALAINYYEMRTGSLPFSGTMLEQLQARLNDAPDLDRVAEPEANVLRKALSRDPEKRFDTCSEFAGMLVKTAKGGLVSPSDRPTPSPATARAASTVKPAVRRPDPKPAAPSGQHSAPTKEIPGVVYHRRQEEDPAAAAAAAQAAEQQRRAAKDQRANDVMAKLRPQSNAPAHSRSASTFADKYSDGKIPVYWVVMIILAMGLIAYFLITQSV